MGLIERRLPESVRMWSPRWLRHVLAAERAGHDRTMQELRECEARPMAELREERDQARALVAETQEWLDLALTALGVETVFDIPGWKERHRG